MSDECEHRGQVGGETVFQCEELTFKIEEQVQSVTGGRLKMGFKGDQRNIGGNLADRGADNSSSELFGKLN